GSAFPDSRIFTEEIKQGYDYDAPCFFISLEEVRETLFLGSRYLSENRFRIRLMPQSSCDKNKECEQVAQRLFEALRWIKGIEGERELLMGRKMSFEIKEGSLYFYVNYDFYIYKTEEKPLMEELRINAPKSIRKK
ncbi:MAG: hypothetical protein NC203_09465, partial [Firmicutes bacterium]|nr:hypothetical protein [Bacillota bacterium]